MTNAETITKLNSALTTLIKAYEELQKENSHLMSKASDLENKVSKLELLNQGLEKDIIQLRGNTEEDKSNLSSILGKIENILNRKVDIEPISPAPITSTNNSNVDSSKNQDSKKEKVEPNILNVNNSNKDSFGDVLQVKNDENKDSNKLDLSRMSSLLNGFNN